MVKFTSLAAAAATLALAGAASAQEFTFNGTVPANGVDTIVFTIGSPIVSPLYFDLTTNNGPAGDTEIGVYLGTGAGATLVANDDDNGIGLKSTLSFGAGSGLLLGDAFNLGGNGIAEGENGNLAAGTYTFVIGDFNTTFTPTLGGVIGGTDQIDYQLDIYTNVPEPTSLSLLGLGGLVALRRRR